MSVRPGEPQHISHPVDTSVILKNSSVEHELDRTLSASANGHPE